MSGNYGGRPRPVGGMELQAWLFMRYSGVVLLALALGHWFIMHVFNSVHVIDYDFVAGRYAKIFWRGYDLTMLWLAMIHGSNGLRTLADDYLKRPLRVVVVRGIYAVAVLFLVIGTWVIVTFKPVAGGGMLS